MQYSPVRRHRRQGALGFAASAAATVTAFALALLTLAACSGPGRREAAPPAPAAAPTTTTTVVALGDQDQGQGQSQDQGQDPAVTEGGAETTVTSPAGDEPAGGRGRLVLDPEGLGVARFGDAPDLVVAAVTRVLGKPRSDTGWKPRGEVYGVCPGTKTRAVTWGQFTALFTDGPTRHGPSGTEHFFLWSVQGDAKATSAATAAGIGLGSTVAELRSAYPGRVRTWEADLPGGLPGFGVGPKDQLSFAGSLSNGRVSHLEAGTYCGE
jgi:hypothetical protein